MFNTAIKPVWLILGLTALSLGILGILLPLLPTVPFVLLAVYCFSRSSQRLHDWLINHKTFGPAIANWQQHRAISRPAKTMATLSIIVVLAISIALDIHWKILCVQIVVLAGVLLFIWTRPDQ